MSAESPAVRLRLADDLEPDELLRVADALTLAAAGGVADGDLLKALRNPLPDTDQARAHQRFNALQRDFRDYLMAEIADADLNARVLRNMLGARAVDLPDGAMEKFLDARHKIQRKRMTPVMRAFYNSAFQMGLNAGGAGRAPTENETNLVERMRRNEYAYLDNFLKDIAHQEGRMDYKQRAELYANALRETFWAGYTYADLSADRYVRWKMRRAEHCPDCAYLAGNVAWLEQHDIDVADEEQKKGFPVGGRWGNGVYSAQEIARLAIFPQSGTLRCTTNCKCSLRRAERPAAEPEGKAAAKTYKSIEPKPFRTAREHALAARRRYEKRAKRTVTKYHPRKEPRKPI